MNETKAVVNQDEFEKGRDQAILFAWVVYAGVVIAATTLFITFVLGAFPPKAYLSRAVMSAASLMVGASMIAFPFSLHKWAVEKSHRRWTIGLYYGEMVLIAVNTIVAFSSLLSKNSGVAVPEWVLLYEPWSIAAIIYTLAAWGTIMLKDPRHKSVVKGLEAMQTFNDRVAEKMVDYVGSVEGLTAIQQAAQNQIALMFDPARYGNVPKHFIDVSGLTTLAQTLPTPSTTLAPTPAPTLPTLPTVPDNGLVHSQDFQAA